MTSPSTASSLGPRSEANLPAGAFLHTLDLSGTILGTLGGTIVMTRLASGPRHSVEALSF
jgi:hypothetical protein